MTVAPDKTLVHVSKETRRKLRMIAAIQGHSITDTVDRLATSELTRLTPVGELWGDADTASERSVDQQRGKLFGSSLDTNARSDGGLGKAKEREDILGTRHRNARSGRTKVS